MNAIASKSENIFSTGGQDALVGEILSFLALPHKWCHGRGGPANINAVLNALQILQLLRNLGYERMEVFPDPAGGVLISAFFGADSIEVLCRETQGNYDFAFESPGKEDVVEDKIDQSLIITKIWEISCAPQKKSSDYYTRVSTVKKSIDSQVWRSTILTTASPLLIQNAQNAQVVTYVLTSTDITKMYLENQPYIGEFSLKNSLPMQNLRTLNLTQGINAITSSPAFVTNTIGSGFIPRP